MREAWTDERLDDFRGDVSRRFVDVDSRFDRVDREIGNLRAEMNTRFDRVDARFDRVAGSIEALHLTIHRTLLQLGFGLIVTMILGFAGIILA